MTSQSFIKNGVRSSAGNAYIESGICPGLTVVTHAFVTKIIFRRDLDGTPVAIGVQCIKDDGTTYFVGARIEVIVSGGVAQSAPLLMLSGVGPAKHLASFGIPLVKNLPVGDNHCNHVAVFNNPLLVNESLANPSARLVVQDMYQLNVLGTGLLAQVAINSWYRVSPLITLTSATLVEEKAEDLIAEDHLDQCTLDVINTPIYPASRPEPHRPHHGYPSVQMAY